MMGFGSDDHTTSNNNFVGDNNDEGMRIVSGFAENESHWSSNSNSCCSCGA